MSEYEHLTPEKNGWSKWTFFPRLWKHQCCNCGELHWVRMRLIGRKIWMSWKTDNRGAPRK